MSRVVSTVLVLISVAAWGDLDVTATSPTPIDGYAELQSALDLALSAGTSSLAGVLAGLETKPLLLSAFANANACSAAPGILARYDPGSAGHVGVVAPVGFELPTLRFEELEAILENFTLEEDARLGFGYGVWRGEIGLRAGFLWERLHLFALGGGWRLDIAGFDFDAVSVGVAVAAAILRPRTLAPLADWQGITAAISAVYSLNRIAYEVPELSTSIDFDFDPDRDGPIPALRGALDIDSELSMGIQSGEVIFPVEVSTGILVLGFLDLRVLGGIAFVFGDAALTMSGLGTIDLGGALAGYQEEPGTLEIGGEVQNVRARIVQPTIGVAVGLQIGNLGVDLSVGVHFLGEAPNRGYSASVGVGVDF